jgi:hypothetical protein
MGACITLIAGVAPGCGFLLAQLLLLWCPNSHMLATQALPLRSMLPSPALLYTCHTHLQARLRMVLAFLLAQLMLLWCPIKPHVVT